MAEDLSEYSQRIEDIRQYVREMASAITRLEDGRLLQAAAGLGTIATGVMQLEAAFVGQHALPEPAAVSDITLESVVQAPVVEEAVEPAVTQLGGIDANKAVADTEPQGTIPATGLSPVQQRIADTLSAAPGRQFKPSELMPFTGYSSQEYARQTVRKALRAIENDPILGPRLRADGKTTSRRYWLEPTDVEAVPEMVKSGSDPTSEAPNNLQRTAVTTPAFTRPTPGIMPSRRIPQSIQEKPSDTDIIETALTPDLTLRNNGYKSILRGGQRIPLRDISVTILEAAAACEGEDVTFTELRASVSHRIGRTIESQVFQNALQEIGFALGGKDGLWKDRQIEDADGEKNRVLTLVNSEPKQNMATQEAPDFLVQPH